MVKKTCKIFCSWLICIVTLSCSNLKNSTNNPITYLVLPGHRGAHPTGDCPEGRGSCAMMTNLISFQNLEDAKAELKKYPDLCLIGINFLNKTQIKIQLIKSGTNYSKLLASKESESDKNYYSIGPDNVKWKFNINEKMINLELIKGDYEIIYNKNNLNKLFENGYTVVKIKTN